ncbi:MAG: TerC family protein [Thermodesulfobacteriota bacterium]
MIWIWTGFIGFILLLLAIDLGVLHRESRAVTMKEALAWSVIWTVVGLAFALFVYFGYEQRWLGLGTAVDAIDGAANDGREAVLKYLTGYVIERSLSVDNVFVIAMIFSFFAVPAEYQHRVLFLGILGALVMRGAMIAMGVRLIAEFDWILYAFGALLILTALRMLFLKEGETDLEKLVAIRLARRFLPITSRYHGEHFIVRDADAAPAETGKAAGWMLTPLALALLLVETTDLVFAVDSIPAIFAITADPFLVFTSNVFAILGMRALYFALAGMMGKFRYLKASLAVVLLLVGGKMLAAHWLKAAFGKNVGLYLMIVIFLVLGAGIAASLARARRDPGK